MRLLRLVVLLSALASGGIVLPGGVLAQNVSGADPYLNQRIETVDVRIVNPSSDAGLNARVQDQVRSALGLFPGERFARQALEFQLSRARRVRDVSAVDYDIAFGVQGGLALTIRVTIAEEVPGERPRGVLDRFPVLYDKDGTYLRLKVDLFGLYYSNNNSWYGRPDLMLAGNPLVSGEPSGEGYAQFVESYVHYGLYGITPLASNFYVYAGISGILSNTVGEELFTDRTRTYNGVEDAYIGAVGGRTDAKGNRLAYNLTLGRKRFTLGEGMLLATTSANGQERAALQANARWAADLLAQARVRYDETMLEFFYVDPDELPLLDSDSAFAGVNLELEPVSNLELGLSYVTAPKGDFSYFGPTGETIGTREGLRVYDARFRYTPRGIGTAGPFVDGELAAQRNANFDMEAYGGYIEGGYSFSGAPWTPTFSYRYSRFTGDDPSTETYERWDPMLAGLSGEAWIQGANHFKVVQISNVRAHRIQGRLRPFKKLELVPQVWAFHADSETNVGGNPALTFLDGDDYGYEVNVTAKWFVNRRTYVHGHLAYTWPGEAVKEALENRSRNWFGAMLFVRYAF